MLPKIIGITGYAGVGKDMAANYLTEKFYYRRRGLADPIKALLNERFGWAQEWWFERQWKEEENPDWGGFNEEGRYISAFSPRSWAQWLGTEAGRAVHGEDCWVKLLSREIAASEDRWVIPDIRFPNEASYLSERWGKEFKCIRIHRPNVRPVLMHSSESSIDGVRTDISLLNDGSPQDLYDLLGKIMVTWRP